LDDQITRDELRDIIINTKNCKHWIYYPLSNNAIKKAQDYYKNLDEVKPHLKYIEKKEAGRKKVKLIFESSNYANELKKLRSDDEFLKKCSETYKPYYFDFYKYFTKHKRIPFFIDIPITGEMIFQCDRRIWQSIIFNRYIYGRKKGSILFNISSNNKTTLFDVLKNEYKIPIDYDLMYKLPNPLDSDEHIWLPRDVINQYLEHLSTLGFIDISVSHNKEGLSEWGVVRAIRSIEPPDKNAADHLQKALQSVDLSSPDINRLIATAFDEN
jgi:hypothetical protein